MRDTHQFHRLGAVEISRLFENYSARAKTLGVGLAEILKVDLGFALLPQ